ncbi:hypothetical protein ACOSQ2_022390 [Xanthoceras sorbifolium]
MLPIRILVRYDTKIADLSYLKPSDCSVVSIINDAWKEMSGKGVQLFDNWKLSVLFPWNRQRHTVISDEELMIVFETFDNQSEDEIEFEISLNPLGVEYPEEHIGLLTSNNEAPPASKNNVTPPATVEEYDSNEDDSYEVDKETGDDSKKCILSNEIVYEMLIANVYFFIKINVVVILFIGGPYYRFILMIFITGVILNYKGSKNIKHILRVKL